MKTVSVAVSESVLGSIKPGDSVVLKSGRQTVTLKAVPSSTWKEPTKAQLKKFCEAANRQDNEAERAFMNSIFQW
jgi:hypothetical protein